MPNIRAKSNENIEAANLLVNNRLFASSIHCAYYSCFQLSKYVLNYFCNCEYDNQDTKDSDSHKYVINKLCDNLNNKNRFSKIDYLDNINRLRRLRNKADYTDSIITPNDAKIALQSANKAIEILTTKYSIV